MLHTLAHVFRRAASMLGGSGGGDVDGIGAGLAGITSGSAAGATTATSSSSSSSSSSTSSLPAVAPPMREYAAALVGILRGVGVPLLKELLEGAGGQMPSWVVAELSDVIHGMVCAMGPAAFKTLGSAAFAAGALPSSTLAGLCGAVRCGARAGGQARKQCLCMCGRCGVRPCVGGWVCV